MDEEEIHMRHLGLLLILFLVLFSSSASAQEPDLDRLDQKLRHHLETKMPGWAYERVEPIQGSEGVLLQKWTIQNRGVSVTVVVMKSAQDAKEVMQRFPRDSKGQPLESLGDEAYTWGYRNRQVVFRRGKNIIYVEAGANVDLDPDARSMTWAERRAREESEVNRLTGEFAKHTVTAIDLP